jgi:hypothetical protein
METVVSFRCLADRAEAQTTRLSIETVFALRSRKTPSTGTQYNMNWFLSQKPNNWQIRDR